MKYPISVVVPTKDRYKYLKSLIEMIIGFETDEIELIIQDNSTNNEDFVKWLSDKKFDWLKYYYNPERLTSIQNFDLAISHSTGECVTFIGDDDGIVRNIVDCAKWMIENNVEAVRSLGVEYQWPECCGLGIIKMGKSNRIIEYSNPIKDLIRMFKEGGRLNHIPVTYAGIVKREILDNLFQDYGTYFPGGASADMANGVALCFYVKRYVKLNVPIIITGTSKNTGSVKDRKRFIPFSEIPFISSSVAPNWEGNLPKYWFGVFVWPESAIKALRALHQESFIQFICFEKIFARAVINAKVKPSMFYSYCDPRMLNYYVAKQFVQYFLYVLTQKIRSLWSLFLQKINLKKNSRIDNISIAEKILLNSSIDFSRLKYK